MSESSVDHVRIFEGRDGQHYYESVAGNGQVLSTSEGYTRREDAVRAAAAEHPEATLAGLADTGGEESDTA